jgi:threonylcarbamoyladenosine tRNA methylthiotransferase MtaB
MGKKIKEVINLSLDGDAFYKKYGRKKIMSALTLGCKVNQYETEAMQELFVADGYEVVDHTEKADVYVINTCTVTATGDKKSRQFIRRAKRLNPDALVAVVGCYSQISPEEVEAIEGVNLVLGTNNRKEIVNYVKNIGSEGHLNKVEDIMAVNTFEEMTIDAVKDKTRAFLKIQEGCNQYCTYCIIPYARGKVRSRALHNIVEEVGRLSKNGFKEIVLTGIHLGSYGVDLEGQSLIEAIEATGAVEGIERVRVGSLEPRSITDDFLKRVAQVEAFCPHFHLSLQSGSDGVLKRMKRRYTAEEYYESVVKIRQVFPEASITTDIIVGFPLETDEEFEETLAFVQRVNFHQIHVFKYSIREGTPAALMPQVDGGVKDVRSHRLIEKAEKMEVAFLNSFVGKTLDVLFESYDNFMSIGHTKHYINVKASTGSDRSGEIAKVKITSVEGKKLLGELIRE